MSNPKEWVRWAYTWYTSRRQSSTTASQLPSQSYPSATPTSPPPPSHATSSTSATFTSPPHSHATSASSPPHSGPPDVALRDPQNVLLLKQVRTDLHIQETNKKINDVINASIQQVRRSLNEQQFNECAVSDEYLPLQPHLRNFNHAVDQLLECVIPSQRRKYQDYMDEKRTVDPREVVESLQRIQDACCMVITRSCEFMSNAVAPPRGGEDELRMRVADMVAVGLGSTIPVPSFSSPSPLPTSPSPSINPSPSPPPPRYSTGRPSPSHNTTAEHSPSPSPPPPAFHSVSPSVPPPSVSRSPPLDTPLRSSSAYPPRHTPSKSTPFATPSRPTSRSSFSTDGVRASRSRSASQNRPSPVPLGRVDDSTPSKSPTSPILDDGTPSERPCRCSRKLAHCGDKPSCSCHKAGRDCTKRCKCRCEEIKAMNMDGNKHLSTDDPIRCDCSKSRKPCSEKSACRCKKRPCTLECDCFCVTGQRSRTADGNYSSDEESVQSTNDTKSVYEDEATIERDGPSSAIDPELRQRIESTIIPAEQFSRGFDSAIGMKELKDRLENMVIRPLLRPDIFTGNRSPPRGVLLYGPPGTGKTHMAKALAGETKRTFFNIPGSVLKSEWHGKGENLVSTLFTIAMERKPSIIFFDELDALFVRSAISSKDPATGSLTKELLQAMDGMTSSQSASDIVVIGATNNPWDLNEALLRRLPISILLPLPSSEQRLKYLTTRLQSDSSIYNVSESDLTLLVSKTEEYSNSDLEVVVKEASIAPTLELSKDEIKTISKDQLRPVTVQDFLRALTLIRPKCPAAYLHRLNTWGTDNANAVSVDEDDESDGEEEQESKYSS